MCGSVVALRVGGMIGMLTVRACVQRHPTPETLKVRDKHVRKDRIVTSLQMKKRELP